MRDMREFDRTAKIDGWWQSLTESQRGKLRDLKEGDPFPREGLNPYSRANLVVDVQREGDQRVDHRVNERFGEFLAERRNEPK
jgi:hypothetical protein